VLASGFVCVLVRSWVSFVVAFVANSVRCCFAAVLGVRDVREVHSIRLCWEASLEAMHSLLLSLWRALSSERNASCTRVVPGVGSSYADTRSCSVSTFLRFHSGVNGRSTMQGKTAAGHRRRVKIQMQGSNSALQSTHCALSNPAFMQCVRAWVRTQCHLAY
jgi:hypothetical protein